MVTPERYPLDATLKINPLTTRDGNGYLIEGTYEFEVTLKVRRVANSKGKKIGVNGVYYDFGDIVYCCNFDEESDFIDGVLLIDGIEREVIRLVTYTNDVKIWIK